MNRFQKVIQDGPSLRIIRGELDEWHHFDSEEEATGRLRIIQEAFSWVGTPFVDCGDVKGPTGAIDCAMLLRRCYVDTGRLAEFDPRPYPPRWHVHHEKELFIEWIERLGGVEVSQPRLADIGVWVFGKCYSHGAIFVNSREVVHAFASARMCVLTGADEPHLSRTQTGRVRPVKYFDVWRQ